jgi:6-phosphogluconolactonase
VAKRDLVICKDTAELSRRTADRFIEIAQQSMRSSGRFAVALSGGSTPKNLYSRLSSPAYQERLSWPNVHLFWGDERCVPPDHPDSNFRMVKEALLSKIEIPPENVHRMAGEREPSTAASEYEKHLQEFFLVKNGALPRFDLILLGVGDDGHTASLFPGSGALHETKRLVLAPFVEKLKSNRLTLTLPVLNQGGEVWFLVTGSDKAGIIKEILSASADLPAAKVQPENGKLMWFIRQDAAAGISAYS